jgi:hypothetical protein
MPDYAALAALDAVNADSLATWFAPAMAGSLARALSPP